MPRQRLVAGAAGVVDGAGAVAVGTARVGAGAQQQARHADIAPARRQHQGGAARAVGAGDRRALLERAARRFELTLRGGGQQAL